MATIQEQVSVLLRVNTKGELGLQLLKPGEASPRAVRVNLFTVGDKGARELYKRAQAAMKEDPAIRWPETFAMRNGDTGGGDPAQAGGEAKLWVGRSRRFGGQLFWTSAEKSGMPGTGKRVRYL
jgi:hypothetical protein